MSDPHTDELRFHESAPIPVPALCRNLGRLCSGLGGGVDRFLSIRARTLTYRGTAGLAFATGFNPGRQPNEGCGNLWPSSIDV